MPKRLTNLLQPADIAWFRPLKSLYDNHWSDWLVNSEKTFTKSNNMRSPGYAQIIEWVSSIWENFDQMIIHLRLNLRLNLRLTIWIMIWKLNNIFLLNFVFILIVF